MSFSDVDSAVSRAKHYAANSKDEYARTAIQELCKAVEELLRQTKRIRNELS